MNTCSNLEIESSQLLRQLIHHLLLMKPIILSWHMICVSYHILHCQTTRNIPSWHLSFLSLRLTLWISRKDVFNRSGLKSSRGLDIQNQKMVSTVLLAFCLVDIILMMSLWNHHSKIGKMQLTQAVILYVAIPHPVVTLGVKNRLLPS